MVRNRPVAFRVSTIAADANDANDRLLLSTELPREITPVEHNYIYVTLAR